MSVKGFGYTDINDIPEPTTEQWKLIRKKNRYRERPCCRNIIQKYIKEGIALEDIARKELGIPHPLLGTVFVTSAIKAQARKMLAEKELKELEV